MTDIVTIQAQNSMQSYCFANATAFEAAQRMATALSKATLVPKEYQNNIPNCILALEIAHRMNASPTMVMQNLYIVHGKPSWSSQFIISAVNSCGRFRPLRFEMMGQEGGDDRSCIAWTIERGFELPANIHTLEDARAAKLPIFESPRISIDMAKKEGWFHKSGSKWQTIPDLMLRYRSASFFGKLYAPEILMGMQTQEEIEDIVPIKNITPQTNIDLASAFMATTNSTITPSTNKLEELLSNPLTKGNNSLKVEKDGESSLAELKCYEVINLLNSTKSSKELENVITVNESHVLVMPPELQDMVYNAIDERKRVLI